MNPTVRRPVLVRALPFAVFMAFLGVRAMLPADAAGGFDGRWLYAVQVAVVAAMLIAWRREYGELSRQSAPGWREAALAVGVGFVVFALWISLDAPWLSISVGDTPVFVPVDAAGALDVPLIVARLAGAALLVPVLEELFWRSFLMRWLQQPLFEALPPVAVGLRAVVLSTFVFVLAHTLWLAAAIAGLAYAWLYVRTGKLWVAVIAHAVTNAALGVWVVATGNWQFW